MDFEAVMAQIAGEDSGGVDDTNLEGVSDNDVDDGLDAQDGDQDVQSVAQQQPAFDPNSITDPVLLEQYRQMQASFTPRLQEAAELRRQFGDMDPGVVEAVRQYQQLLQTNPYEAREYLAQQQAWLDQQLQVQQPQDPFNGVEPVTDTEAALLNVARQMWQQQQQQNLYYQQLEFQRRQDATGRTFAELESAHKTTIPQEDRNAVLAECRRTGCSDVGLIWKALNFDKAVQKGVQKGSSIVKQKQKQTPPPTNRQQRSAPPQPGKGKGIAGHFDDAWNKFAGS